MQRSFFFLKNGSGEFDGEGAKVEIIVDGIIMQRDLLAVDVPKGIFLKDFPDGMSAKLSGIVKSLSEDGFIECKEKELDTAKNEAKHQFRLKQEIDRRNAVLNSLNNTAPIPDFVLF